MDRVSYEEENMVFHEVDAPEVEGVARYFEWVPKEALSSSGDEKFPLVITYHGSGDHPVFEAEGNGWIQMAAKERLIIVAPEGTDPEMEVNAGNNDTAVNKELIDYVCEKYPVDRSRIYVTGFSLGAHNTLMMMNDYPDVFAAAAPIAGQLALTWEGQKDTLDLPVFYGVGTKDIFMAWPNEMETDAQLPESLPEGQTMLKQNIVSGIIEPVLDFNDIDREIDMEALDYSQYGFLGFDVSDVTKTITTKHGFTMDISTFENTDQIPMFKLAVLEGVDHNHYTEWAPLIWDYFKHFSRDMETGEVKFHE